MTEKLTREDISQELTKILRRYVTFEKYIMENAALHGDLAIYGDDADELFDEIHNRFGTSFIGYSAEEYFSNEVDGGLEYLAKKLFGYRVKRKQISVKHLIDVVERGSWFDPQ